MTTKKLFLFIAWLGGMALLIGGGTFVKNMGNVQPQREYINAGGGVTIPDDFTGIFRAQTANAKRAKNRRTAVNFMLCGGGLLSISAIVHRTGKSKETS